MRKYNSDRARCPLGVTRTAIKQADTIIINSDPGPDLPENQLAQTHDIDTMFAMVGMVIRMWSYAKLVRYFRRPIHPIFILILIESIVMKLRI